MLGLHTENWYWGWTTHLKHMQTHFVVTNGLSGSSSLCGDKHSRNVDIPYGIKEGKNEVFIVHYILASGNPCSLSLSLSLSLVGQLLLPIIRGRASQMIFWTLRNYPRAWWKYFIINEPPIFALQDFIIFIGPNILAGQDAGILWMWNESTQQHKSTLRGSTRGGSSTREFGRARRAR